MSRWWLVVNAAAGAWLVAIGAYQFGILTQVWINDADSWLRPASCCIAAVSAFLAAKNQSPIWCGILAALVVLLNPLAPTQWPRGWERPFDLAAGSLLLAFSVRWWK
ncbi:MAG: hypothetical protein K8R92_04405 [Planctomycetes bacterium]|nr:hypothetical protein [Planctomycetota bacterium]